MAETLWQQAHRATLHARLAPFLELPDGALEEVRSPFQRSRIVKHGAQIHFYFVNDDGALDGPMSRIDLREPLHLIAEYTQAALLTLLWKPEPERACLIGLAGGRLSLVCYHHLPALVIDNIELDPVIPPLAKQYFGLTFDDRQRLLVGDARDMLAIPGPAYDLIVMDAFRDASDNLDQLATRSFYADCKRRLVRGGVLAANMLTSDPLFREKAAACVASFAYSYAAPHKHGVIFFGNDLLRLSQNEIERRASVIQHQRGFAFPFEQRAAELMKASDFLRARGERPH